MHISQVGPIGSYPSYRYKGVYQGIKTLLMLEDAEGNVMNDLKVKSTSG